jgi:hypothetical protein
VDQPQFSSFELEAVSEGRPLSVLAYALIARSGVFSSHRIQKRTLARWGVEGASTTNLIFLCTVLVEWMWS